MAFPHFDTTSIRQQLSKAAHQTLKRITQAGSIPTMSLIMPTPSALCNFDHINVTGVQVTTLPLEWTYLSISIMSGRIYSGASTDRREENNIRRKQSDINIRSFIAPSKDRTLMTN